MSRIYINNQEMQPIQLALAVSADRLSEMN